MSVSYRPEITGLRAVAVVPVILFHAGVPGFGGGFVGVDVFFVISGYLIASIIAGDLETGSFRLLEFYERRARRILPALIVMCLFCLAAAWLLMKPSALDAFVDSLAAVGVFASNFYFWRQSGYFAPDATTLPLLHTWSLAVEEQFYLLFPLVLAFLWQWRPHRRLLAIGALTIASLALCSAGSRYFPAANFYLSPSRSWELTAGALAALWLKTRTRPVPKSLGQVLSGIGLLLIATSVMVYNEQTPFPAESTIVPVAGALLVIMFTPEQGVVRWLLSSRPLVAIGLISYSAYLWHYPVFAFAHISSPFGLDVAQVSGLLLATFVAATASWAFVEQPFRDRRLLPRRGQMLVAGAVACLSLLGVGLAASRFDGFGEFRFGKDAVASVQFYENLHKNGLAESYRAECDFYDWGTETAKSAIDPACTEPLHGKTVAFLWGDSHAQALSLGLRSVLGTDVFLAQVASSGCSVSLTNAVRGPAGACQFSNPYALDEIERLKPDTVYLAQAAGHDRTDWDEVARALHALGVRSVVLFGPVPQWRPSLPEVVAYGADPKARRLGGYDPGGASVDATLKVKYQDSSDLTYVSLMDALCDNGECTIRFGDDPTLIVVDHGHLSPVGSVAVARLVASRLPPVGSAPAL